MSTLLSVEIQLASQIHTHTFSFSACTADVIHCIGLVQQYITVDMLHGYMTCTTVFLQYLDDMTDQWVGQKMSLPRRRLLPKHKRRRKNGNRRRRCKLKNYVASGHDSGKGKCKCSHHSRKSPKKKCSVKVRKLGGESKFDLPCNPCNQ